MPFGPFISQEEKNKINSALHQNYGSKPKPVETQAEKTQRINRAVRDFFTPKGTLNGGAGGMMSGQKPGRSDKPRGGMPNLGPNYADDETAATIVAASHNPLAAGANPEARRVLGIDSPKPPSDDGGGGGGGGGTGRGAPDPAGTGAKGTNTSFKGFEIDLGIAEKYLGRGIADVNTFVSNSLPTVDISGKQFDAVERPDGTYDAPEMVIVGGKAVKFSDLDSALNSNVVEGISTPGKTSLSPVSTADNKRVITIDRNSGGGARTDYDERTDFTRDYGDYEGTDYSPIRKARRAAFLSGDDGPGSSMRALNNANASVGTAAIGGNFYVNDGGTLRQVTKEAYGKANTSGLTSEELSSAYIGKIKENLVPTEASLIPAAEPGAFNEGLDLGQISSRVTSKDLPGISEAGAVEFNMNNQMPGFPTEVSAKPATTREQMKIDYFAKGDDDED